MNLELQQRAVEYNAIIKKYGNLRDGLFEQMPPIEQKEKYLNDDSMNNGHDEFMTEEELKEQQAKNKEEVAKTLLDLFDDDNNSSTPHSGPSPLPASTSTVNNNILDLFDTPAPTTTSINPPVAATSNLDDIFGGLDIKAQPIANVKAPVGNQDILDLFGGASTTSKPSNGMSNNLDDLFGSSSKTTPSVNGVSNSNDLLNMFNNNLGASNSSVDLVVVVYEKNDLKITVEPENGKTCSLERPVIKIKAHNTSFSHTVTEFLLSSAVPKSMQLQLSPPTTRVIEAMESMHQTITITNPTRDRVRLRAKITYKIGSDTTHQDQFDVSNFPDKFFN